MRVLIGYDGSASADAALEDLRKAGLPRDVEALIVSSRNRQKRRQCRHSRRHRRSQRRQPIASSHTFRTGRYRAKVWPAGRLRMRVAQRDKCESSPTSSSSVHMGGVVSSGSCWGACRRLRVEEVLYQPKSRGEYHLCTTDDADLKIGI